MRRYIDADKLQQAYKEIHGGKRSLLIDTEPTADVRENVQLDVCPLYGGVCGYPSGECYDCPRHGNFRENVRGEWAERECGKEEKDEGWETVIVCSHCDFPATTFYSEDCNSRTQIRTRFCPNCGADMRGDKT